MNNKFEPIPVDIDLLLDMLEKAYTTPLERWLALRGLLALQKDANQQSVNTDVLPCGHDPNNLRMGFYGYGCAECAATRR